MWHQMHWWCQVDAPVHAPCHASESMSSNRGEVLQQRLHQWSPEQGTGVMSPQMQGKEAALVALVTKH